MPDVWPFWCSFWASLVFVPVTRPADVLVPLVSLWLLSCLGLDRGRQAGEGPKIVDWNIMAIWLCFAINADIFDAHTHIYIHTRSLIWPGKCALAVASKRFSKHQQGGNARNAIIRWHYLQTAGKEVRVKNAQIAVSKKSLVMPAVDVVQNILDVIGVRDEWQGWR